MIIELIMNIVYTLHAMQEKLKDPIRSIFSSAFIYACLPLDHEAIPEKFHPVKFFPFKTLAWCMPQNEAPSAEIGCEKHSWLSYNAASFYKQRKHINTFDLIIVLQLLRSE